ncbi:MAG: 16S rRNA (cytidine(1402)-2'-O)-methyltransferase [Desulfobacula sp.]|nr:16S rRNA (cytidine(1402)-2'-O)-methyltransferase [Desulfobacula sp.]
METQSSFGTLYIVATPLGNLADITFRAVDILKQVNLIAAEDTRYSRRLLNHYDITTSLISCHEHNEVQKIPRLIADLKNGTNIALISDAGTPTISDPGYKLIQAAAKHAIKIIPIPGCSAAIAGLSVAGLPTDSFLFIGFLPKKAHKQKQILESLKELSSTLIIYESPKRIKKSLQTMIPIMGDREACLAREITKLHEEYIRGTLSYILQKLDEKEVIKGECSLFVKGCTKDDVMDDHDIEAIVKDRLLHSKIGTSQMARQICVEFNLPRKQVYDLILKFKG